MKPLLVAAALALAAPPAVAQVAQSDTPSDGRFARNPNIDIAYVRPADRRFARHPPP